MSRRAAALALALGLLSGCAHVQTVEGLDAKLRERPDAYITGRVVVLEHEVVLDRRDFVYAIDLSPDGERAAFTHLPGRTFDLAISSVRDGTRAVDVTTNPYVHDVEALAFSPDGRFVATAGRDGAVRLFDSTTGALTLQTFAEEPLVSIAFTPDGQHVLAGSVRGRVMIYAASTLAWTSEAKVHSDEVRALAIGPNGRVVTGSWDKTVAVFQLEEAPLRTDQVRLVLLTEGRTRVVRAALDGWAAPFTFDAARPWVIVSEALAKQAGIEPSLLTDTVLLDGQTARVAKGRTVQLKHLEVENVDVAICDPCLPTGAQGVLGAPVLERFEVRLDEAAAELVLTARNPEEPSSAPTVRALREIARHPMGVYVNDLSIDRSGARAGIACSGQKAERNREVYEREKRGDPAPYDAGDFAAILDLDSGEIVRKWAAHRGVVSTAGISPDGETLASGGWDKKLYLVHVDESAPRVSETFGWSVRRVRFSRDGRLLAVGAWTPQKATGDQQSDPSAVIYELGYGTADVRR